MAMSSPSPIAAAANLLLTRHSRRCRCHYRHPQLAPRRRQPPSPIAPTPFSVAAALQTRPIAAERAVHTSAGGTHDLQSPPTWGFSVRSDETVAIPPQKWHLIATRFKTDTRKGQFDDLPGRSRAFVWPRRRLWGPTFAWPCRPLRGPTFAWPSDPCGGRRSPGLADPCGGRRSPALRLGHADLLRGPDFARFLRLA